MFWFLRLCFFKLRDLYCMSFYNVFQGTHSSLETVDFFGYIKLFNHIAVLFSDQLNFGATTVSMMAFTWLWLHTDKEMTFLLGKYVFCKNCSRLACLRQIGERTERIAPLGQLLMHLPQRMLFHPIFPKWIRPQGGQYAQTIDKRSLKRSVHLKRPCLKRATQKSLP